MANSGDPFPSSIEISTEILLFEIVSILHNDALFCNSWKMFCLALPLQTNDIIHLERMFNLVRPMTEIILEILTRWRSHSPVNANVTTLCEKLKLINCNNCADSILLMSKSYATETWNNTDNDKSDMAKKQNPRLSATFEEFHVSKEMRLPPAEKLPETWHLPHRSIKFVGQDEGYGLFLKENSYSGTVQADGGLRIRATPSTSAEIVGSLANGASVSIRKTVQGTNTNWFQVFSGYVSAAHVITTSGGTCGGSDISYESDNYISDKSCSGSIQADGGVRIRSTPSTSAKIVGSLANGAIIKFQNIVQGTSVKGNTNWIKVSNGYISAAHVRISSNGGNRS